MSTTIEEALAWLHKAIGETWTPRELLARILRAGHERRTPNGRFGLPIKAAPPIDTKFGAYRLDGENGTLALPFVRQFGMPWQTVPLWPPQIEQLFHCGETTACVAEEPDDDSGEPGRYILIEPLTEPARITLSMVRIPDEVLLLLATVTTGTARTDDEQSAPMVQASASAPDLSSVRTTSADIGSSDRRNANAASSSALPDQDASSVRVNAPVPANITHRLTPRRRDILSPAIEKAVQAAGTHDVQTVFLELREMALRQEKPFTGEVVGDALGYTDSKNRNTSLTRTALYKRLYRGK